MQYHIYVLALKNRHKYVGRSKNVDARIQAHKMGVGSRWTQIHPVVNVVSITPSQFSEEEDMLTKRLMKQYSIDRVRGGSYSQPTLSPEEIKLPGSTICPLRLQNMSQTAVLP